MARLHSLAISLAPSQSSQDSYPVAKPTPYFGRISTMAVFQQNTTTTNTIKSPHIALSASPNEPDGLILKP